jgi:hypothetical protein
LLERKRSAAAEDFHPFGLAEPGERAGAESAPLKGGGKRPFCGKPAGQSGRFETEGFAGMRGRAGPLPLPPGGMLCEFTRPYPALTLAMVTLTMFTLTTASRAAWSPRFRSRHNPMCFMEFRRNFVFCPLNSATLSAQR